MKPILFNTEMVQALLDRRKTVTRRVVKPHREAIIENIWIDKEDGEVVVVYNDNNHIGEKGYIKPKYQIGEILWVRETFYKSPTHGGWRYLNEVSPNSPLTKTWKKVPSIHMPREAARIFLKVTGVRVERLQDITDEQAEKEGVPTGWPMEPVFCPECKGEGVLGTYDSKTLGYIEIDCYHCNDAKVRFKNLWNSTIKKKDLPEFGWDANPWVFVYEFERYENES
ncbi:hypothetical protein GH810_14320 [Acetobacterium paludosum]|uniref:ASCH domain-containing protein n=1 Tax=Acetobacterium paludosum TaxID=52693 RepID=A0A923HXM8_9FIRM|nr:hypothetical protein [Acetobacterium paludosum]MBC3889487.1 hypothetical protein [Acetobacterium paludosum]